jgi:hypothetical protein
MRRVKLDKAGPEVKKFFRSLPVAKEDVELELDGAIVCKVSAANRLSDAEKAMLRKKAHELLKRSHERNKDVPAAVIAKEVEAAISAARSRR